MPQHHTTQQATWVRFTGRQVYTRLLLSRMGRGQATKVPAFYMAHMPRENEARAHSGEVSHLMAGRVVATRAESLEAGVKERLVLECGWISVYQHQGVKPVAPCPFKRLCCRPGSSAVASRTPYFQSVPRTPPRALPAPVRDLAGDFSPTVGHSLSSLALDI